MSIQEDFERLPPVIDGQHVHELPKIVAGYSGHIPGAKYVYGNMQRVLNKGNADNWYDRHFILDRERLRGMSAKRRSASLDRFSASQQNIRDRQDHISREGLQSRGKLSQHSEPLRVSQHPEVYSRKEAFQNSEPARSIAEIPYEGNCLTPQRQISIANGPTSSSGDEPEKRDCNCLQEILPKLQQMESQLNSMYQKQISFERRLEEGHISSTTYQMQEAPVVPSFPSNYPNPEEFRALESKSVSPAHLAQLLMLRLFSDEEMKGKYVDGRVPSEMLDSKRVKWIKDAIEYAYPAIGKQREDEWKRCQRVMESYLRRLNNESN